MLCIAAHGQDGPLTSREIADRQGIPEPYLRQILAALSKGGLIVSNRGPQGGHALARDSERISLRDILLLLEGQTTSVDHILSLPCTIEVGTEHCAIREVFLQVKQAVEAILRQTTLAVLQERQERILLENISVPADLPTSSPLPIVR